MKVVFRGSSIRRPAFRVAARRRHVSSKRARPETWCANRAEPTPCRPGGHRNRLPCHPPPAGSAAARRDRRRAPGPASAEGRRHRPPYGRGSTRPSRAGGPSRLSPGLLPPALWGRRRSAHRSGPGGWSDRRRPGPAGGAAYPGKASARRRRRGRPPRGPSPCRPAVQPRRAPPRQWHGGWEANLVRSLSEAAGRPSRYPTPSPAVPQRPAQRFAPWLSLLLLALLVKVLLITLTLIEFGASPDPLTVLGQACDQT